MAFIIFSLAHFVVVHDSWWFLNFIRTFLCTFMHPILIWYSVPCVCIYTPKVKEDKELFSFYLQFRRSVCRLATKHFMAIRFKWRTWHIHTQRETRRDESYWWLYRKKHCFIAKQRFDFGANIQIDQKNMRFDEKYAIWRWNKIETRIWRQCYRERFSNEKNETQSQ